MALATELLHELKRMLLDQNFKLADLSSDVIPPSLYDGKVCVDHLKCSIVVSACTRAFKYRNVDQSNAPASTDTKSSTARLLPSELHQQIGVKLLAIVGYYCVPIIANNSQ